MHLNNSSIITAGTTSTKGVTKKTEKLRAIVEMIVLVVKVMKRRAMNIEMSLIEEEK